MSNLTRFGKLPSQHIQQALDALIAAEQPDSWVKPNMNRYHNYREAGPCFACLGGLAAISEYNFTREQKLNDIHDADAIAPGALNFEYALDGIRMGWVSIAFNAWGMSRDNGRAFDRHMPNYNIAPIGFKQALQMLIADLQTAGY